MNKYLPFYKLQGPSTFKAGNVWRSDDVRLQVLLYFLLAYIFTQSQSQ